MKATTITVARQGGGDIAVTKTTTNVYTKNFTSLQDLEGTFQPNHLDFEIEEGLIIEDDEEEQDKQHEKRVRSLKSQELLWETCANKVKNVASLKEIPSYNNRGFDFDFQEQFKAYFQKFSGNTMAGFSAKDLEQEEQRNKYQNEEIQEDEDEDIEGGQSPGVFSPIRLKGIPNFMEIKLATMKDEESKQPIKNQIQTRRDSQDEDDKNPYETSFLVDDEELGLGDKLAFRSLKKPSTMPPQFIISTAFSNSAPITQKNNNTSESSNNKSSQESTPDVSDFIKAPLDCTSTPFGCQTPFEFEEADIGDDEDDLDDGTSPNAKLKYAAYFEQQRFLQKQQQLEQQNNNNNNNNNSNNKNISNAQASPIVSLNHSQPATTNKPQFTEKEFQYFQGSHFQHILNNILAESKKGNISSDIETSEYRILPSQQHESKWTRVYLKNAYLYVQLRSFETQQQMETYLNAYSKVLQTFSQHLPVTVFYDTIATRDQRNKLNPSKDGNLFILVQKLGEFSLRDLANLVIVEAKAHPKISYEKYYLSTLASLFDAVLLFLTNNYYLGNIAAKNVYLSNIQDAYKLKFSSLVDFSFDYNTTANPFYTAISAKDLADMEIWYNELYACCRCVQEMIERDAFYLEKRHAKEFLAKFKPKYTKLTGILGQFLLRNELIKGNMNFDAMQQLLSSSFSETQEKTISISTRSAKHIGLMVQSSQIFRVLGVLELGQQQQIQQMFFFAQQLNYHQDWDDNTARRALSYLISQFFRYLYNLQEEREKDKQIKIQQQQQLQQQKQQGQLNGNSKPNSSNALPDVNDKKKTTISKSPNKHAIPANNNNNNNQKTHSNPISINNPEELSVSSPSLSLADNELLWMTLEQLVSESIVYRKDKLLQKAGYSLNILLSLQCQPKVNRMMNYWKYLTQTSSLLGDHQQSSSPQQEIQSQQQNNNPISLYLVGMFNFYMLDHAKSNKFFNMCAELRFVPYDLQQIQVIIQQQDGSESQKQGAHQQKNKLSGQQQNKPSSVNFYEEVQLRESYKFLCELHSVFYADPSSARKIEALLLQSSKGQLEMLSKVIALELVGTKNLAQTLRINHKDFFFVSEVNGQPNSQSFNRNGFLAGLTQSQFMVSLIDNARQNFANKQQTFANTHGIVKALLQLFAAQTELQLLIGQTIAQLKGIQKTKSQRPKTTINLQ